MTVRRFDWHRTPHGEWMCAALSLLAVRRGDGWYLCPFTSSAPMQGPYTTLEEAQTAAEASDESSARPKPRHAEGVMRTARD